MRFVPFGDAAWRARLDGPLEVARRKELLHALRGAAGVADVVVSEEHVLVVPAEPDAFVIERIGDVVARVLGTPLPAATATREHLVAVRYDGEDLESIARATRLAVDDIVRLHGAAVYEVAAVGFLPGFAYLRGLDGALVLPRRATPRPRVVPGSVAIAGPYSAIYPFASPGGWHLLGVAVGFSSFTVEAGATLALGDRVRFEVAA
ncbi:MAG TPA: carboxyltransferase domain-containing protein [Polyangiaceae bacterium]|jgi:UPF0271 protein